MYRNRPDKIVIHHSLTKDSGTVSWGAIRDYHIGARGWADIGYHAGIELVGDKYECFYGRPDDMQGAHTQGENHNSLGFCFIGNFDEQDPDPDMLATAVQRVLAPWCRQYRISVSQILGHRVFANKSCPGDLFSIDVLRDMIETELE